MWAQIEEGQFVDKHSGIGVVVSERVLGRVGYSFQIVHFDDHGGNKFIPYPLEKAPRPLKEVIYLLVERACEFMEERSKNDRRKPRSDGLRTPRRVREGGNKESGPQGLSALAKADADKKGKSAEFTGKTAKKKSKGKS